MNIKFKILSAPSKDSQLSQSSNNYKFPEELKAFLNLLELQGDKNLLLCVTKGDERTPILDCIKEITDLHEKTSNYLKHIMDYLYDVLHEFEDLNLLDDNFVGTVGRSLENSKLGFSNNLKANECCFEDIIKFINDFIPTHSGGNGKSEYMLCTNRAHDHDLILPTKFDQDLNLEFLEDNYGNITRIKTPTRGKPIKFEFESSADLNAWWMLKLSQIIPMVNDLKADLNSKSEIIKPLLGINILPISLKTISLKNFFDLFYRLSHVFLRTWSYELLIENTPDRTDDISKIVLLITDIVKYANKKEIKYNIEYYEPLIKTFIYQWQLHMMYGKSYQFHPEIVQLFQKGSKEYWPDSKITKNLSKRSSLSNRITFGTMAIVAIGAGVLIFKKKP